MSLDTALVLKQIDEMLGYYVANDLRRGTDSGELNAHFCGRVLALLVNTAGPKSPYTLQVQTAIDRYHLFRSITSHVAYGILQAFREDVASGYLISLQEQAHAALFADYLEMADYLLSDGFKDAAAVIIGGTLEEHLRQLCIKHNVSIEVQTASGLKPKKADTMNADLHKAGVYSLLDQKNVTAWLDLRNRAAHGQYATYSDADVSLFLQSVRHFISKYPA